MRKILESVKQQDNLDSEVESLSELIKRYRLGKRAMRYRSILQSLVKELLERSQFSKEEDEEEMIILLFKYKVGNKAILTYKLCLFIVDVFIDICLFDID